MTLVRAAILAAAVGVLPPQPVMFGGTPVPADGTWWLENDGFPVGMPDADVDAARAWAVTTGDPGVLVAIVDTGVEIAHPDLAAAIYVNADEIPGNGIDDDGNGLDDDVSGWDFADDDADTTDPFGITHGTPVAGLVAGSETGLAPGVTLLPVKVFSNSGSDPLFEQAAADGILYAVDRGADVIQISWVTSPGGVIEAALATAIAADVVVVAPAGNSGESGAFPASYSGVIGVAGSDRYDRFVDVPGYLVSGAGVPLAAPTEKLTTTTLTTSGVYVPFTGTSAAAPLVSAAAALVRSANPALTAAQVRDVLLASADPLPELAGRVTYGRLNAGNAVRLATAAGAAPPRVTLDPVEKSEALAATVYDARDAEGESTVEWTFVDRDDAIDGLVVEHRFFDGGVWPVTVEVTGSDGLTHTAHTETRVPFRGVAADLGAAIGACPNPHPACRSITVPGANALRLRFSETVLSGSLILYDEGFGAIERVPQSATGYVVELRGSGAFLFHAGYSGTLDYTLEGVDAAFDRDVNRAPVVRVTGASGAALGNEIPFGAVAVDPDGDAVTVTWRLLQRPEGSSAELSLLSGTETSLTPDTGGDYAIVATATDALGESSSTLTWIVTRDRDADGGFNCSVSVRARSSRSLVPLAMLALLFLAARRRRSGEG